LLGKDGARFSIYLANGAHAIALLGETPGCGLRRHEGFGEKEEQIAREGDGEMHCATPAARWPPKSCLGLHMVNARCVPKSACDDLLSQLTAGSQVSGIRAGWKILSRIQSDEGDVT